MEASAAVPHVIDGKIARLSVRTLWDWVRLSEGAGMADLIPLARATQGWHGWRCGSGTFDMWT